MEEGTQAPAQRQGVNGFWGHRTSLEKVLLGVSCVAMVACAALVGVVATSSSPSSPAGDETPWAQPLVMSQHVEEVIPPQQIQEVPSKAEAAAPRLQVLKGFTKAGEPVEVCNTEECILAAADILEAIDTSVDPCQDFYRFACGNWIEKHPVPDDATRWAQFDLLDRELNNALSTILSEPVNEHDPKPINKAKTFYSGCMDEARLEALGEKPLTDFLSQFGGWPMTDSGWDAASFDWQNTVAESRSQASADYLVNVWVFADQKDTYNTAIYIDQTSLGMPRSVLTEPGNYAERINAYKTYIASTAKILAASLGQDGGQIEDDVEDVMAFEMALANITSPSEARRNIERMYNPMTVVELGAMTNLDWLPMLSTMFASSGVTIEGSTRVIVQETAYVTNLTRLVAETSPRTLSNYLMWRHVKTLGDDTTQAMRDASFQYDMVASGVSAAQPRNTICSQGTNNYLGMAVGTKYVGTYFPQQAKDEANVMVEDLRSAFEDLLGVNEWMDTETKPRATEKAEAIAKFIGYPDWYGNDTAMEAFYGGLGDVHDDMHFANILTLKAWLTVDELGEFGKASRRDRWFSPPTIVNAYYMPEYNSITFPAGILQPPFYRSNSLMALNYGGIGQVIGHEITHGFDDQGRQNDKDGNALPWWSNATLDAFKSRAKCIVDQYGNMRLPELDEFLPNATLNGINTQGENIADNGGLREALLAYMKYVDRNGEEPRLPGLTEYTPTQLLFLNNANIWCTSITTEGLLNQVLTDPHSPSRFRVNVPMINLKEFSTIWECPAASPMNPEDKCVVW